MLENRITESVKLFENPDFGQLTVVQDDSGRLWFVASQICSALGTSTQNVRSILRPEQVSANVYSIYIGKSSGKTPLMISESGLYSMVLKSRKAEAEKFQSWVTEEVLPSIRRTGGYMATVADETPEETMARALLMADDTIKRQRAKLAAAEPKAALCDAVLMPSKDCCTVSEAARYLANIMPSVRRQDVFDKLRATGMMCKRGTAPTRAGIDTGRMVAVASEYRDPETGEVRAGQQRGKLTMKGVGFLTQALAGEVA